MTAPSEPRIRARKPKVRSGCLACKARRVKCGEERPICRRCQKAWLPCKYSSSESNQSEHQSHAQKDSVTTFQVKGRNEVGPRILLRVQRSDFDEFDVLYFDLFRSTIVENLCLNGYTNLWSRTILRESFQDECVRDCVRGIGALRRAMMDEGKDTDLELPLLWTVPTMATACLKTRYQRDAIRYYTKAISSFRSRMSQEGSSIPPRTILIISILFIIFESMQGNTDSVDRIVHAAMLAIENSAPGLGLESGYLDDDGIREADYFLTRFSVYNSLLSPFYPSLLGGEATRRNWLLTNGVPAWNDDFREIELAFERYTTSSLVWLFRACQACVLGHPLDPIKHTDEQLVIWHQAKDWAEFISQRLDQETDPLRRRSWKMMLADAKMFSIYSAYSSNVEERELVWDSLTDECRDAVTLIESILDEVCPSTTLPPLFEDKLFPILRGIVCKCRHYEIRSRAMKLCRRLSGPWFENQAVLVGMRVVIELEERGRDEYGNIPSWSRYRWDISSWNEDRTELRMGLIGITTAVHKEINIRQDENIDDLLEKLTA
ncbi:hypothetical protein F4804DRAFT_180754 [Jackrogersella minutella]|nr:hypothetical protein F4804DRAFT_180754 [Jackrogersella minutella]